MDPGLGFGKSPEGNLALLRHLSAFRTLGFPIAVGASRKAFVRRFSGIAQDAAAAAAGAALVRVHDVADTVRFLRMSLALSRPAPVEASMRVREGVR